MTRTGEQIVSNAPFARVLTRVMWSKTPPWSASKTAAVLGIHRTRVANWVYHGIIPELDTMLIVMARLGIPISDLLDAYAESGIPVPPLQSEPQPTESAPLPAPPVEPGQYAVPGRRTARSRTGHIAASEVITRNASGAASAEDNAQDNAEDNMGKASASATDEWETMLAHTREVMSLSGMPEAAIDAMLNHIKQVRDSGQSDIEAKTQRRIEEEHQQQPRQQTRQQTRSQPKGSDVRSESKQRTSQH